MKTGIRITVAFAVVFVQLSVLAYASDINKELIKGAQRGGAQRVKELIAQGADVNTKRRSGWTSLMIASRRGHTETVNALLAAGADVNTKEPTGRTSLMMASRKGHTEIVKALLAAGADANIKDKHGYTCLKMAAISGHIDIVKALLAAGADVDYKTYDYVRRYGKKEISELLFEAYSNLSFVERLKDIQKDVEIEPVFAVAGGFFLLACGIASASIASYKNRSAWRWLCIGLLAGPLGFMVILFPGIAKPAEKPLRMWEKSIERRVLGYKIGLSFVLPLGGFLLFAHFFLTSPDPDETNIFAYGSVAMILIPLAFFKWELSRHRRIRERRSGELTDRTYKKGKSIEPR
jgi:hypothetical protein